MFGKYTGIEAFLDAYETAEVKEIMDVAASLSIDDQVAMLRNQQGREMAEVNASIQKRLSDDTKVPKHYQMMITLNKVLSFSPAIKKDILLCKANHLPVFLAIRFGDRSGIMEPIATGMQTGDTLHVKGEWITSDKAFALGGAKTPVLHFTHHPIGFTCTVKKCYS